MRPVLRRVRWTLHGIVDGPILGALTGAVAMFVASVVDPIDGDGVRAVLGMAAVVAVHGAVAGLGFGAVAGVIIDVLRQLRVADRVAVWLVVLPILVALLWVTRPTDPGAREWIWYGFPVLIALVVVGDLSWRLRRHHRFEQP